MKIRKGAGQRKELKEGWRREAVKDEDGTTLQFRVFKAYGTYSRQIFNISSSVSVDFFNSFILRTAVRGFLLMLLPVTKQFTNPRARALPNFPQHLSVETNFRVPASNNSR